MNVILDVHYQQSVINSISNGIEQQTCAVIETQKELQRPSVMFKPSLQKDGNQWSVLYGIDLHDGIAGFGDTVDQAMKDFDTNWFNEKTK